MIKAEANIEFMKELNERMLKSTTMRNKKIDILIDKLGTKDDLTRKELNEIAQEHGFNYASLHIIYVRYKHRGFTDSYTTSDNFDTRKYNWSPESAKKAKVYLRDRRNRDKFKDVNWRVLVREKKEDSMKILSELLYLVYVKFENMFDISQFLGVSYTSANNIKDGFVLRGYTGTEYGKFDISSHTLKYKIPFSKVIRAHKAENGLYKTGSSQNALWSARCKEVINSESARAMRLIYKHFLLEINRHIDEDHQKDLHRRFKEWQKTQQ